MKRCQSLSPGGMTKSGKLPKKGTQCGLEEGHDGLHTVLIPTGYPWAKKDQPSTSPPTSTLFQRHPRPWSWHFYGDDDEFIRDANGNALFEIGFNSSDREEIVCFILNTVNKP